MLVRALALIAVVLVLLSQKGDAQSLIVAWDPAVSNEWTVPEYRTYKNTTGEYWATTAWQIAIPVVPGEAGTISVSSYGWRLNDNLDVVWAEGARSAAVPYAVPSDPPPPPALSLVAPPDQVVTTSTIPVVVTFPPPTPVGGVAPYSTSCTPASGSLFYEGATNVVCAVYDSAGQIAHGSFGVTVVHSPPPTGCLTNGTLAPIGSRLTQTLKNGDADPFIAARRAEGWVLLSRKKAKSLTTVSMECRGL